MQQGAVWRSVSCSPHQQLKRTWSSLPAFSACGVQQVGAAQALRAVWQPLAWFSPTPCWGQQYPMACVKCVMHRRPLVAIGQRCGRPLYHSFCIFVAALASLCSEEISEIFLEDQVDEDWRREKDLRRVGVVG